MHPGNAKSFYAVIVEFEIVEPYSAEFLRLLDANVRSSLGEPGCRRFDILLPADGGGNGPVLLYEIYVDKAAFEAHLATPHYHQFASATEAMVGRKSVKPFNVLEGAGA